jgi:hypothetical protein
MGMKSFIKSSQFAWAEAWDSKSFRWSFIMALVVFLIFPWKADDYFQWIQGRKGTVLGDWLLEQIPAFDVSKLIFAIIYMSVIYLLISLIGRPKTFLWFAWAFNIETTFRFASIYLVALEPPLGLVDLHDPLAEIFIYGENMAITKDLFFSGHTATMVFVAYFLPTKQGRFIAIGLTGMIMVLLAIQHVHYSIDIIAAPIVTWISIQISQKVLRRFGLF